VGGLVTLPYVSGYSTTVYIYIYMRGTNLDCAGFFLLFLSFDCM